MGPHRLSAVSIWFLFGEVEQFLAGSRWRLECVRVHGSFERAGMRECLALDFFQWEVTCRISNDKLVGWFL